MFHAAVWSVVSRYEPTALWWATAASAAMAMLSAFAGWWYLPKPGWMAPGLRVGVVVPCYNEDPVSMRRGLETLIEQTRPPDLIVLVDDASTDDAAWRAALALAGELHVAHWVPTVLRPYRLEVNGGKRHAQAVAFRSHPDIDVWVTVDSDTVLQEDCIEQLLGPLVDPRVVSVTGRIHSWNWSTNLLTRVVDVEMSSSAIGGRALPGIVDAVLVNCGAVSAYRGSMIRQVTANGQYLGETFRGRRVNAGDDRRLAQLSLIRGRTAYAEGAVALSLMPERFSHLVAQRIRWSSSWYRGTMWSIRFLPLGPALALTLTAAVRAAVSIVLTPWLVLSLVTGGNSALLLVVILSGLALVRSVRLLLLPRPDQSVWQTLGSLVFVPLVVVLQFTVLTWLHWWAVTRVFDQRWGTRAEVEVST